jgi:hypothetical protein
MRCPFRGNQEGGVRVSQNILVVYKKNFEDVHDEALDIVKNTLEDISEDLDIKVNYSAREKVSREDFIERDLVVVLGGDGTLTSIAHSVDEKTPVMGVNSHPREMDNDGSYGFYMGSDPINFGEDIRKALSNDAIVNILPRLQAEISTTSGNIIRSDPALNDLLLANTHQYQPSKYKLQRKKDSKNSEINCIQYSSGCLFSTFLGQGAWYRHINNIEGTTFPENEIDNHYLFVSRDLPRNDRRDDGTYWAWTNQPTIFTSDMHRGYVVADGWDETHFTRGATISVSLNGPSLKLLTFRNTIYDRVSYWIKTN